MYVCLCHGVTDKHIKQVVEEGQVSSLAELSAKTGCATCCGQCAGVAANVIEESLMISDTLIAI